MKGILPKVRKSITIYLKKTKSVTNMTASRFWICITHPLKTICVLFIVTKQFNVYNRESILSFSLFKFFEMNQKNRMCRLERKFMVVLCLDESSRRYSALTYICRDSNSVVCHDAESHKCGSSLDGTAEAFICQSKKRSTWFQRSRALNVKRCCGIIGRKRKYCGHTSCFCHSLCWLAQFLQGYLIKVLTLYIYSCRHSCRLNLEPILASIGHDVGYTLDRLAICSGSIFMLSLVFAIILVSWALLDLITAISFVTDPAVFMFLLSPPVSFHICTWKDWEEK